MLILTSCLYQRLSEGHQDKGQEALNNHQSKRKRFRQAFIVPCKVLLCRLHNKVRNLESSGFFENEWCSEFDGLYMQVRRHQRAHALLDSILAFMIRLRQVIRDAA
jgi:hypothetical protein